jgi:hypothetical protein
VGEATVQPGDERGFDLGDVEGAGARHGVGSLSYQFRRPVIC